MEEQSILTILAIDFVLAFALGVIVKTTNFCTMGAISDWINMGNKGRLGAWVFAMAITATGMVVLEGMSLISLETTIPPFRMSNFMPLRYILGGFIFGVGMTLASGCGNRTLINIGSGNMKSVVSLICIAIMSYSMTKTDLYEIVFHPLINATSIDLKQFNIQGQGIDQIIAGLIDVSVTTAFVVSGGVLSLCLFFLAIKMPGFLSNKKNVIAGFSVGGIIIAGWYLTGGVLGQEAIETAEWMEQRPIGIGVQSYTFINPIGEAMAWLIHPQNTLLISFGVVAVFAVLAGSIVASLITRQFQFVWFTSKQDFINHVVGGLLMGVGGVLAFGCTIGQAVSGLSTLAIGSFLTVGSIFLGSVLTMKTQFYRMCYEDESFKDCFMSALVDVRLLPASFRKLEEL